MSVNQKILKMELDEFKEAWKKTEIKKNLNTDIMKMLQHKSQGPLAALKREFRKQIIVMAILPLILILTVAGDVATAFTSILFWTYVVFCLAVIIFASFNYRRANKMSVMDGAVKSTFEQQLNVLQERLNWLVIGLRITLLFFVILVEVVPYFQHYRMLDKWHSLSPFFRFGCYIALLLIQYFVGRRIIYRKFGSHVAYLKELVKEME